MDLRTPLTIIALTVPFLLLTVWAIVDALQREFGTIGKKAVWCLVAAIPFIGFVIYFIAGRPQGRKPQA